MSLKPKVALSNDFLLQLAKLPAKVHSKVMKWAIQFQADPTSPGINYETIHAARDANLRSVRLDGDWRGIVFKPNAGDVYVLLYVGHHDDAYRWAENRKLSINPVTGAMQLVTLEQVQEVAPAPSAVAVAAQPAAQQPPMGAPLFAALSELELMSLGVPAELLGRVRQVPDEGALDQLQPLLPVEAYEALFLVAAGDTVSQVLHARETRVERQIDTQDFAAALATPESQSRFVVVSDDESLAAILNAPLAQWRVFLHPTQHKLATGDRSGPVRVLGGAGTGKTVLAMHRARWLADQRAQPGQKVLFTTFTKNLAADIEHHLKSLCGPTTMPKLEVTNLDAWVHGFMRARKLEHRIVYDRKQDGALQAWQSAMAVRDPGLDLPEHFYQQELEQVVLAQGISSLDEYREVASVLLAEQQSMVSPYAAIVIDETQDFGPQALKLLRAMIAPGANDLFFVGDGHQRIYSRHKAAMSKCGIDIRGRCKKLYLNYRTTDEIRKQAVALLEGVEIDDLDDGHDESKRYRSLSHGPAPLLARVDGLEAAFAQVKQFLAEWQPDGSRSTELSFCVVASSEKNRDALGHLLQQAGVRTLAVTAQSSRTDERGVVYLSTMHRAKGLEFDCVAVVAPKSYLDEPGEGGNQRQLLYVALTRAKRGALMVLC